MPRFLLTVLVVVGYASAGAAQQVPGRDLLQFPLGTIDRAAALPGGIGDGLGNPATIALDSAEWLRAGVAALRTPSDQGVSVQLAAVAIALPGRLTVGAAVVRASVSDLLRTETDPRTIGREIPYSTVVYSITVARRHTQHFTAGLAVRYRHGELDDERRGAFGLDGGLVAQHLAFRDASIGAATFLWRPANADEERTTVNVGGDLRLLGRDAAHQLRAGYSLAATAWEDREDFVFVAGRHGAWEARAGMVRTTVFGGQQWRMRLGVRVHYAEYMAGVAREENGAGLSPIYQFTLSSTLR